jgi:hypothetical protein
MDVFMELLNKVTATRNAQLVHMRNPTMFNNFTKIVYEVSFDAYLKDLTKLVALSGHNVKFPEDWVKPKIEDLMRRYSHCDEFNADQIKKAEAKMYDASKTVADATSDLANFQHCSDCRDGSECKHAGCLYDRIGL